MTLFVPYLRFNEYMRQDASSGKLLRFPTKPEACDSRLEPEALEWVPAACSLLASHNPHDVANGRQLVRDQCDWLRLSSADKWCTQIIPALRSQTIYDLLLEDPITRLSSQKLRGYPGDDAPLLDLLCGRSESLHL